MRGRVAWVCVLVLIARAVPIVPHIKNHVQHTAKGHSKTPVVSQHVAEVKIDPAQSFGATVATGDKNFKAFDHVIIHGLDSSPEFNGQVGVVEKKSGDRWIVRVSGHEGTFALKPEKLTLVAEKVPANRQDLPLINAPQDPATVVEPVPAVPVIPHDELAAPEPEMLSIGKDIEGNSHVSDVEAEKEHDSQDAIATAAIHDASVSATSPVGEEQGSEIGQLATDEPESDGSEIGQLATDEPESEIGQLATLEDNEVDTPKSLDTATTLGTDTVNDASSLEEGVEKDANQLVPEVVSETVPDTPVPEVNADIMADTASKSSEVAKSDAQVELAANVPTVAASEEQTEPTPESETQSQVVSESVKQSESASEDPAPNNNSLTDESVTQAVNVNVDPSRMKVEQVSEIAPEESAEGAGDASAQVSTFSYEKGDKVRIKGLSKKPEFNGKIATVTGREGDRVLVKVEGQGGEIFALKPENLEPIEESKKESAKSSTSAKESLKAIATDSTLDEQVVETVTEAPVPEPQGAPERSDTSDVPSGDPSPIGDRPLSPDAYSDHKKEEEKEAQTNGQNHATQTESEAKIVDGGEVASQERNAQETHTETQEASVVPDQKVAVAVSDEAPLAVSGEPAVTVSGEAAIDLSEESAVDVPEEATVPVSEDSKDTSNHELTASPDVDVNTSNIGSDTESATAETITPSPLSELKFSPGPDLDISAPPRAEEEGELATDTPTDAQIDASMGTAPSQSTSLTSTTDEDESVTAALAEIEKLKEENRILESELKHSMAENLVFENLLQQGSPVLGPEASEGEDQLPHSSWSDVPLRIGDWYHKIDTDFDLDAAEFEQVPESAKGLYFPVDNLLAIDRIAKETWVIGAGKPIEVAVSKRSDISGLPLVFDHWYHKRGSDYDINDFEFNQLKSEEQAGYFHVSRPEDTLRITREKWTMRPAGTNGSADEEEGELPAQEALEAAVVEPETPTTEQQPQAAPAASTAQLVDEGTLAELETIREQSNPHRNMATHQAAGVGYQKYLPYSVLSAIPSWDELRNMNTGMFADSARSQPDATVYTPQLSMHCSKGKCALIDPSQAAAAIGPKAKVEANQHPGDAMSVMVEDVNLLQGGPAETQSYTASLSESGLNRGSEIFVSDLSGKLLKLGQWYHNQELNRDITESEFMHMGDSEQQGWERINTPQQVAQLQNTQSAPPKSGRLVAETESMSPAAGGEGLYNAGGDQAKPASLMGTPAEGGQVTFVEAPKKAVLSKHDKRAHSHKPFRSNLSGRPLFLGRWYHKRGSNYDIAKEEFDKLDHQEQKRYIRIEHHSDLDALLNGDLDHQILCPEGAVLEEGTQCIRDKNGHRHIRHVSDISAKPLFLGKWFHKRGENFDVTEEEFNAMGGTEKTKYARIDTIQDYEKLSQEFDDPATKQMDKTAINPVPSQMDPKAKHKFVSYHSDVSGKMLELGKWYHRLGQDVDVASDEWMKMPAPERVQFVRIDSPGDVEKVEHEQWVRKQNDLIAAENQGTPNLLTKALEGAIMQEKDWLAKSFQKYTAREEDWYRNAKLGLIRKVPTLLQHSDHSFAGVKVGSDDNTSPLIPLEDVGLKSTAGYKIKLAAEPKIPEHVSNVGSGFDGNTVLVKQKDRRPIFADLAQTETPSAAESPATTSSPQIAGVTLAAVLPRASTTSSPNPPPSAAVPSVPSVKGTIAPKPQAVSNTVRKAPKGRVVKV